MIYINGIKASKEDIERLLNDIKNGITKAYGYVTKDGNLAIKTKV